MSGDAPNFEIQLQDASQAGNGAKHSPAASLGFAGGPPKGNLEWSNVRRPEFVTLLGHVIGLSKFNSK